MTTRLVKADEGAIREAAHLLQSGELVVFPTETVYGLGADARREEAIRKIYEAKGRPVGNPVIVHVSSVEMARGSAAAGAWDEWADALAKRFWPGPLTVIVRRGDALSPRVSAGRGTVALRFPSHPVALELLIRFGGPIAAPSANRSGFTSPTTAQHVLAELAGRVPLILDGGICDVGLESTVVDVSGEVPVVLRPGAVTVEMLREVIGRVEVRTATVEKQESAESPGQHSRHYAPRTAAYRFSPEEWPQVREWAGRHGSVALLTWTDDVALAAPHETLRLPEAAAGYARVLYAALREADEKALAAILVLLPGRDDGIWAAVTDRLRRATVELPIE